MRIFAQKQNQPQKPASSSLARVTMAPLGLEDRERPFLDLPRPISGNRAGQRMLPMNADEQKSGLNDAASALVGHDFSRIPIHPQGIEGARSGSFGPQSVGKEKSEAHPPPETTHAIIQRKPRDVAASKNQSSVKEADKKAELEFHSTIAFKGANSGSSSTGPSQAGFTLLGFQWTVWNSGWETAPEHVDRVTLYQADRCSGCRDEKDEILRMEVTEPATVPITQPGEGEFKYEAITPLIGMTLPAGHYDVYVDLDVYDEVEEINEDNNTIFTTFFAATRHKPEPDSDEEE